MNKISSVLSSLAFVVCASTSLAGGFLSAGPDHEMKNGVCVGTDRTADIAFAQRALTLWKKNCAALNQCVATHKPDASFRFLSSRSREVTQAFDQQSRQTLETFLASVNLRVAQFEDNLTSDVSTEGAVAWYESLQAFGIASFVGAEWIIVTPSLKNKIHQATIAPAHKLFNPKKFGFKLNHQSQKVRREMRQICRAAERKFVEEGPDNLSLDSLPTTWAEFNQRKGDMLTQAKARMSDAISACQAQIDQFILMSSEDKDYAQTIALRVEREYHRIEAEMVLGLASAYQETRQTLRAQFVAALKGQSVHAVKDTAHSSISLEILTADYKAQLVLLDAKFRLISDLQKQHEKSVQVLATQSIEPQARKFLERIGVQLEPSGSSFIRDKVFGLERARADQFHEKQVADLLATSIDTLMKESGTLERLGAQMQIDAAASLAASLQAIRSAGIGDIESYNRVLNFRDRIATSIELELKGFQSSRPTHTNDFDQRRILIDRLEKQKRVIFESRMLLRGLARQLEDAQPLLFKSILADYLGQEMATTLSDYLESPSKMASLLTPAWRCLQETFAFINALYVSDDDLAFVRKSLRALFRDTDGAITSLFDDFASNMRYHRHLAKSAVWNINVVASQIHNAEAERITSLIVAMTAQTIVNDDVLLTMWPTLDHIRAVKWLVSYVDRVHKDNTTAQIKQYLIRVILSENMETRFGAQRGYRDLLKNLKSSKLQTIGTTIEPSEDVAAAATSKSKEHEKETSAFTGIPNMGNTCFANVVIQALTRMSAWTNRPLGQMISQQPGSDEINQFRTLTLTLVDMVQKGNTDGISKTLPHFFNGVYSTLPNFVTKAHERGRQQDAQEFWIDMLYALGSDEPDFNLPISFRYASLLTPHPNNAEGTYTDIVPIRSLMLPITGSKPSIKIGLNTWMTQERIEREGFPDGAFSQPALFMPPEIMIILLHRFDAAGLKITAPVSVSEITIPFRRSEHPKAFDRVQNETYRLVGSINHNGKTTHSGHYYFIDYTTDMVYDDNATYKRSLFDANSIKKHFYILFFQRLAR